MLVVKWSKGDNGDIAKVPSEHNARSNLGEGAAPQERNGNIFIGVCRTGKIWTVQGLVVERGQDREFWTEKRKETRQKGVKLPQKTE